MGKRRRGASKSNTTSEKVETVVRYKKNSNEVDEMGEDVEIQQLLTGQDESSDWQNVEVQPMSNPKDTGFFKLDTVESGSYDIVNGQIVIKQISEKQVVENTESKEDGSETNASRKETKKKAKKSKKKNAKKAKQSSTDQPEDSSKETEVAENDAMEVDETMEVDEAEATEKGDEEDSDPNGENVVVLEELTGQDPDSDWTTVETKAIRNPKDFGFFKLETIGAGEYEVIDGQIKMKSAKSNKKEKKSKKEKKQIEKQTTKTENTEEEVDNFDPIADSGEWGTMNLHPILLRGLHKMKFNEPTPIQKLALPAIVRAGKDVLACAETGSGKTLAFGLPILNSLLYDPPAAGSPLSALILTPTRELAIQVATHMRRVVEMGQTKTETTPVKIGTLVGGMALPKQKRVLGQSPDIIVATPGRLSAFIDDDHPHLQFLQTHLRFLAVDEADRMLDRGHFPELKPIIQMLASAKQNPVSVDSDFKTHKRQTLLFSATLLTTGEKKKKHGPPRKKRKKAKKQVDPIVDLMNKIGLRGKPKYCVVEREADSDAENEDGDNDVESDGKKEKLLLPEKLRLCQIECPEKDKDVYLYYFLCRNHGRTLVFVNTIASLRRLAATFKLLQVPNIGTLHANMQQRQRLKHLDRFRAAKNGVLIATDVAARGLDIPGVDYVVNHGVASNVQVFLHRSGRTARAQSEGLSLTLMAPSDTKAFLSICRGLYNKHGDEAVSRGITPEGLDRYEVERSYMDIIHDRVRVAKQLQRATSVLDNRRMDKEWLVKNANDAGIVLDEEELNDSLNQEQADKLTQKQQKQIKRLRTELNSLLKLRLVARGANKKFITVNQAMLRGETGMTGALDPARLLEIAEMSTQRASGIQKEHKIVSRGKRAKRKR